MGGGRRGREVVWRYQERALGLRVQLTATGKESLDDLSMVRSSSTRDGACLLTELLERRKPSFLRCLTHDS